MPTPDRPTLTSPVWGALIVALLLAGFVVMLDHVAHCDQPAGHCIPCSLFIAISIIAAVGPALFSPPKHWGRISPALVVVRSTGLPHRPVRAPPSILL